MSLALIHRDGHVVQGDRLVDTVFAAPGVSLDLRARRVVFNNCPDSVSFGPDYSIKELHAVAATRALVLLKRRGWTLYRADDQN